MQEVEEKSEKNVFCINEMQNMAGIQRKNIKDENNWNIYC